MSHTKHQPNIKVGKDAEEDNYSDEMTPIPQLTMTSSRPLGAALVSFAPPQTSSNQTQSQPPAVCWPPEYLQLYIIHNMSSNWNAADRRQKHSTFATKSA